MSQEYTDFPQYGFLPFSLLSPSKETICSQCKMLVCGFCFTWQTMTLFTLGLIPGKGQTFNYKYQQEAVGPGCISQEKSCLYFFSLAASGRFELKVCGEVLGPWIFSIKVSSFLMFKILHWECLHHNNLKMNDELSELVLNPVWSPPSLRTRVSSNSAVLGYMSQVRVNSQTVSIWVEQNTASIATTNETILKSVILKISFLCHICSALWNVKGGKIMRKYLYLWWLLDFFDQSQ